MTFKEERMALIEEKKTYEDIAFDLTRRLELAGYEIEALKESEHELLEALKQYGHGLCIR